MRGMIKYTVKTDFEGKKPIANCFFHYDEALAHANACRITAGNYATVTVTVEVIELLKYVRVDEKTKLLIID